MAISIMREAGYEPVGKVSDVTVEIDPDPYSATMRWNET